MSFSIVNSSLGGIPRKRNRFLRCPNGRIVFRCRKDNNQSIPSATRNNSRIGRRIFRAEHQAKKKSRTEGIDLHAALKFLVFLSETRFNLHIHHAPAMRSNVSETGLTFRICLPIEITWFLRRKSYFLETVNIRLVLSHLMRKRESCLHQGICGIDLPGLLLTVKRVL